MVIRFLEYCVSSAPCGSAARATFQFHAQAGKELHWLSLPRPSSAAESLQEVSRVSALAVCLLRPNGRSSPCHVLPRSRRAPLRKDVARHYVSSAASGSPCSLAASAFAFTTPVILVSAQRWLFVASQKPVQAQETTALFDHDDEDSVSLLTATHRLLAQRDLKSSSST
eukprot:Polyplicarium_translucidae@DN2711_c0_g1_i2.p1